MKNIAKIVKVVSSVIFYFLSPTLFIATIFKKHAKQKHTNVRQLIKRLNTTYLSISSVLFIVLCLIDWFLPNGNKPRISLLLLVIIVGYYSFSRVNEVFAAFIRDASSHLKSKEKGSDLKYYERIPLAMKSYLELILDYGMLFYVSQYKWETFKGPISLWQATYFSAATITTTGFGDIHPEHFVSQLLAVYEVLNGFTLIVISFTIYVSRSIAEREHEK
jgi:voltage-gated potassium channel